jgi:hypothetical protein
MTAAVVLTGVEAPLPAAGGVAAEFAPGGNDGVGGVAGDAGGVLGGMMAPLPALEAGALGAGPLLPCSGSDIDTAGYSCDVRSGNAARHCV